MCCKLRRLFLRQLLRRRSVNYANAPNKYINLEKTNAFFAFSDVSIPRIVGSLVNVLKYSSRTNK